MTLEELVRVVHTMRTRLADASGNRKQLEAEFREQHAAYFDREAEAKSDLAAAETALREQAKSIYEVSGEKAPAPGVGVRVKAVYHYDPAAALEWAKAHGMALQLDERAFKDLCKAESTRPPFVEAAEEPEITIATDLSKVLAEAGV